MKYIRQFTVILFVTAIGELMRALIPLPIPGSVYGLLIMLVCLITGAIKLEQVENAAQFLIGIMPVMFLPALTGLMDRFLQLRQMLIPVLVIVAVTTVLVMVVSGKAVEAILKRKSQEKKEDGHVG